MANDNITQSLITCDEAGKEGDLKGRILEESKKIWRIATPSVVARVTSFGTMIVTQSFIGHIGSTADSSGYALVQSLTVQFASGILLGMSSATETLCGQAYGAKQYHMMGIYLQRSWLIDLITLTILLPTFLFGGPIFNLLGQETDVARSAGIFSYWLIPFVYGSLFTMTMQMFLQAQQKNMILAVVSAVQFVVHIALSYLFVNVFGFGIAGAMSALCISTWFTVISEFVYVFGGWCPETWKGFTLAATKDLLPVVKLSVSSGLMICLELWYYSILVLLAGYTENAQVAIFAFSICFNVTSWVLMITVGLLGAACVRVANELGRGDAKATRFAIKVVLSTSALIGLCFFILCLVFGDKIGYFFTSEADVADTVSDLSTLLAFQVLLGSIYPVLSGVAVGAGLQARVAVINLVCFYFIGLTVGCIFGYVVHLEVKGIWMGLCCGAMTQTLSLIYMVWSTDWDQEVAKTSARLQKWYLDSSNENKQISGHA